MKLWKCKHNYIIAEKSNILQLDDMGYPLMLCIAKCRKCGKSKQIWVDVNKKLIYNNKYEILKWEEAGN